MDIHNIANLESPLYNTLVSKAQRDPWTYSLLANVPSFSKQRVEVQPSGAQGQGLASERTYHFKIPRYGLLSKVLIKTSVKVANGRGHAQAQTATTAQSDQLTALQNTATLVKGQTVSGGSLATTATILSIESGTALTLSANSTTAATDVAVTFGAKHENELCDGAGWYMYKDITLQTHNKRIQQLTPEYLHMRAKALPQERRKAAENRARDKMVSEDLLTTGAGDVADTTSNALELYTDCPFSFSERPQNFLDTRFVENLEVVATSNKIDAYGGRFSSFDQKGVRTGAVNLSGGEGKNADSSPILVCYFINPTEELYRAYQERNFTLERPLTMLWYDVFVESPELSKAVEATKDLVITKKLDCNNLVFATHILVTKEESAFADQANYLTLAEFQSYSNQASYHMPIKNVSMKGTSRSLVDTSGFELMTIDQEAFGRTSEMQSANGINETDQRDCIYTIHWGLDGSRTSCSGALSLKNIAAPEISVTIPSAALTTAKKYQLKVFHEFFQLVSIQGSDGRVSVGVSV
jgi:hypothetical protein